MLRIRARNRTIGVLLLLMLAFAGPAAVAQGPCERETFEGVQYTVCSFDLGESDLRLFWRNAGGEPYRSFSALADAVEDEGGVLSFAMNGGMFWTDFTPIGLHVELGRELRPVNTAEVRSESGVVPNFYKKPNGVFYTGSDGVRLLTTERFLEQRPDVEYATQSGPMLVIDDALHPSLIEGSTDLNRRTGVGVCGPGLVRFAISEALVNFHDFARFFRDRLGCSNAPVPGRRPRHRAVRARTRAQRYFLARRLWTHRWSRGLIERIGPYWKIDVVNEAVIMPAIDESAARLCTAR